MQFEDMMLYESIWTYWRRMLTFYGYPSKSWHSCISM